MSTRANDASQYSTQQRWLLLHAVCTVFLGYGREHTHPLWSTLTCRAEGIHFVRDGNRTSNVTIVCPGTRRVYRLRDVFHSLCGT